VLRLVNLVAPMRVNKENKEQVWLNKTWALALKLALAAAPVSSRC
jgi:hypothetical protein